MEVIFEILKFLFTRLPKYALYVLYLLLWSLVWIMRKMFNFKP